MIIGEKNRLTVMLCIQYTVYSNFHHQYNRHDQHSMTSQQASLERMYCYWGLTDDY